MISQPIHLPCPAVHDPQHVVDTNYRKQTMQYICFDARFALRSPESEISTVTAVHVPLEAHLTSLHCAAPFARASKRVFCLLQYRYDLLQARQVAAPTCPTSGTGLIGAR